MLTYVRINLFVLIVTLLYSTSISYSQKTYETKQGTVIINTNYKDSSLIASSRSVVMRLDYADARLKMEVDVNSFRTGIDTLDLLLKNSKSKIYFEADLDLSEISTKNHSVQKFNLTGVVYSAISKKKLNVPGTGKLQHISEKSGFASCLLWLDFTFNTKTLNWDLPIYKIDEDLNVQIIQVLLSRSN